MTIFITGTDTGVGKTVACALLLSACRQMGRTAFYWKPIQTGQDSDWQTVKTLATPDCDPGPRPLYEFSEPAAPLRAAEQVNKEISLARITAVTESMPSSGWIIEGAGGLLVPIARPDLTMASLALALQSQLFIVASARLGAINHMLLTLQSAREAGLSVRAIIWTGDEDPGLEDFMASWLDQPMEQFRVPLAPRQPDSAWVLETARVVFPPERLGRILSESQ